MPSCAEGLSMKNIAVVTDVINPEFMFPLWHKYYASHFGPENLFVIRYINTPGDFNKYKLGGVISIPAHYDNELRARFLSSYCTTLLQFYNYVIRVDVDEILIPDLRIHKNLKTYMDSLDRPYVTAMGLDVIASRDDLPLNSEEKIIIRQRKFAYPNTSLNKTSIVGTPTRWRGGFHCCTLYPKFHELYLLHLKLIDIDQQVKWAAEMLRAAPGDSHISSRYILNHAPLIKLRDDVFLRQRVEGWGGLLRESYVKKFFSSVVADSRTDGIVYSWPFFHDHIIIELPIEFSDCV
jgi:hypothetical protein